MQKGDEVMVYQDPITKKKEEGKAVLLKELSREGFVDGKQLTRWLVHFLGDDKKSKYERSILEK